MKLYAWPDIVSRLLEMIENHSNDKPVLIVRFLTRRFLNTSIINMPCVVLLDTQIGPGSLRDALQIDG